MDLRTHIRDVPDFPQKGVLFKDITTLLKDGEAFRASIEQMAEKLGERRIDLVVGTESRGFIFSSVLAYRLGTGFVPVRKSGKLPSEKFSAEYELEYGTDVLQIHTDAITEQQRVLVVDDLLATGGTARATCELVERCGGKVEAVLFLIELSFLNGREALKGYDILTVIDY